MNRLMNRFSTYWQDSVNLLLGAGLFLSPWLLGFASEQPAASDAHVVGAVLVVMALAALFAYQVWEECVSGVVGAWLVVAPWAFRFSDHATATYTHVLIGIAAIAFAISAAGRHDSQHMTAGR